MSAKKYAPVSWTKTKPLDIARPPEVRPETTGLIAPDGRSAIDWRPAGETNGWKPTPFAIQNPEPIRLESLIALPDGSLVGNACQYAGFFRYHPDSKKVEFFGKSGPSAPCLALAGGKVYIDGYPNTVLSVYDPAKPWTATAASGGKQEGDNPKWLGTLGQGCAEAHHCKALVDGGNGRVYLMGQRERWSTGTGLGYYDTATGKFFGLGTENKDLNPLGLAVLSKAGRVVFSGVPRSGGDARLVVYDLDLKVASRLEIFPGQATGGQLFTSDRDAQFLGCLLNPKTGKTMLYRYDLAAGRIDAQAEAPAAELSWVGLRPADGTWWCLAGGTLYALDAKTLETRPRFSVEGELAYPNWVGKDIYATRGGDVVRVAVP